MTSYSDENLSTAPCLKDLSLQVLKHYITGVLHYFIETPSQETLPEFKAKHVEPIVKQLEEYFQCNLPCVCANDVVNQLMNCLSECVVRIHVHGPESDVFTNWCAGGSLEIPPKYYNATGCKRHNPQSYRVSSYFLEDPEDGEEVECCDVDMFGNQDKSLLDRIKDVVWGNEEASYMNWCYSAAHNILNAIYQPSVTKLIANKEVSLLNDAMLSKMKGLEEIHIGYTWYSIPEYLLIKCLKSAHGLLSLTYSMCTDEILAIIPKSCPQLKKLSVAGSEEVTNRSVSSIVKMRKLEELDIANTRLNEKGVDKLCAGLSADGNCPENLLKLTLSYTGSREHPPNLTLLVETFPNLTSISLCPRDTYLSLAPLTCLNSLTDLSIVGQINFEKEVFEDLGKQIESLHLSLFVEVDLNFIHEHFPNLRTFVLCQDRDQRLINPPAETLPEFPSVQHLGLTLEDVNLMVQITSKCLNLKQFRLEHGVGPHHLLRLTTKLLELKIPEINLCDMFYITLRGEKVSLMKLDDSWGEMDSKETSLENYTKLLKNRLTIPLEELLLSPWWWSSLHDVSNESYILQLLW